MATMPSGSSRARLAIASAALSLLACGVADRQVPDPLYGASADDAFVAPDLEAFTGDLDGMRERRLIRALVTPSRTDFFVDDGRIRGMQAELLQQFAKRLNAGVREETEKLQVRYVPVPFNDLIPALRAGRGDVAAAFLTLTEDRSDEVLFTAPFRRRVTEVVVTHRGSEAPARLEQLAGRRLYVLQGSSYAEHLRALDARFRKAGLAGLEIEEADPHLRSEDILELVNAGVAETTVIDDYKAQLWTRVLPDIVVHDDLDVSEGNRVAWAVRPDSPTLKAAIDLFVREAREGALLGNVLLERYFGDEKWISDPTESAERDKLSRYLDLFRKYGDRFGFDPLALAAQAYQESGLDPDRRSAAGAVGLMQVLPSTAADPQVAVPDIESPDGNVHAGAKYLAFLRDRYFDEAALDEWDQRAFAWAAYNAGPRKVREARDLAGRMGLDRDVWFGNVEVAVARLVGREPVRYVANIYRYFVAYRLAWEQQRRREVAREEAA